MDCPSVPSSETRLPLASGGANAAQRVERPVLGASRRHRSEDDDHRARSRRRSILDRSSLSMADRGNLLMARYSTTVETIEQSPQQLPEHLQQQLQMDQLASLQQQQALQSQQQVLQNQQIQNQQRSDLQRLMQEQRLLAEQLERERAERARNESLIENLLSNQQRLQQLQTNEIAGVASSQMQLREEVARATHVSMSTLSEGDLTPTGIVTLGAEVVVADVTVADVPSQLRASVG